MNLVFIPVAEAAAVDTLMKSIDKYIINPLIALIFALALVYFIYGLVRYLLSPNNEEIRSSSKSSMLWGVIGMFIMVSVFGIMKLILTTTGGDKNIQLDNSGNYTILNTNN